VGVLTALPVPQPLRTRADRAAQVDRDGQEPPLGDVAAASTSPAITGTARASLWVVSPKMTTWLDQQTAEAGVTAWDCYGKKKPIQPL
jgi:hypothetical protein